MTYTGAIGHWAGKLLHLIVRGLSILGISPNFLTLIGLLINIYGAYLLAFGRFRAAALVIIGAGVFDMVDGRVARMTNQVTQFGGFFDSVVDRYSDLVLLMGLLIYYSNINRPFYIILTAVVMTVSVMISYTRSRSENTIPLCKVGFLERPERIVLLIIGGLADRMAPVLWVIALLGNLTVIHRIHYTWQQTKLLDDAKRGEGTVVPEAKKASAV
jgi:CDP-diacylglycerol---glycerol-3-phosphate 3-phosphatidyltransferase